MLLLGRLRLSKRRPPLLGAAFGADFQAVVLHTQF
jgi:hypothetical protein